MKHTCDGWHCDFCDGLTCVKCGGVMDAEGNCACAKCNIKENLKSEVKK